MARSFFSIIITALNPGKKLASTLSSVLDQTWEDYEVIIKDGGSTDGSLCSLSDGTWDVALPRMDGTVGNDGRIRILQKEDRGIYDGMNQALPLIQGVYVLFLNCGDELYDSRVLERVAGAIRKREGKEGEGKKKAGGRPRIYYGDQFNTLQSVYVHSAPRLDDFACYRNVPCHQVCFYEAGLLVKRGYDTDYRVRADYEHFLWCIYEEKAEAVYLGLTISRYEGGGFSETKENRKRSGLEHRVITRYYMGRTKSALFRLVILATLAPLRTKIAEDPKLSKGYNTLKSGIYGLLSRKGGNGT